jgi:molybdopterin synthase catalytic subunit
MKWSIQESPIDYSSLIISPGRETGSVVVFQGIVRGTDESRQLKALYYDSDADLAKQELKNIMDEAIGKFKVDDINAVHRIGMIEPGEISLLVIVFSKHRKDGFRACEYVVDEIKSRLPIWKKDIFIDDSERWH